MNSQVVNFQRRTDFAWKVWQAVVKPAGQSTPVPRSEAAPKSFGRKIPSSDGLIIEDLTDALDWDARIAGEASANLYASRSWGTYKARLDWTIRRIAINGKENRPLAYVQYQVRQFGPARFILVQGSPILTSMGASRAESVLRAFVEHLKLRPLDLLGVNFQEFQNSEAAAALLAIGFVPVVTSGNHTLEVDLTAGIDKVLAGVDRNFRRGLAKARRNPELEAVFLTDPEARLRAFDNFTKMYAALQRRKGFSNSFRPEAYRDIAAAEPRLVFLEVRERDEPILVRIAHKANVRWTDFFTASNHRAQATNAAALSVWSLIERAEAEGAPVYDLGGIDPASNRGVFDFKRSISRCVVQSTPLWLYGRSRLLRSAAVSLLVHR